MVDELRSATVLIELAIAVVIGTVVVGLSRHYTKDITERQMKADFLRTPTATTISVLGLVLPVLVALTAYLYTTRPNLPFGSLLATTALYFVVLILAIWETFAILKLADTTDNVKLAFPKDRRFMTAIGLMYAFLALGLFFFAYFFLFELSRNKVASPSAAPPASHAYLIARPALSLDMSRADVLRLWGEPTRVSSTFIEYDSNKGTFRIVFDTTGTAAELIHRRK